MARVAMHTTTHSVSCSANQSANVPGISVTPKCRTRLDADRAVPEDTEAVPHCSV